VRNYRIHMNEVALSGLILFFVLSGLLLIYSTSSVYSMQQYGNQYHFFYSQFIFACIGFCIMTTVALQDYRNLKARAPLFLLISGCLLLTVWFPVLGKTVRGATRWIDLGPVAFQPSELMKVAIVIYLASRLSKRSEQEAIRDHFFSGYVKIMCLASPFIGVVFLQNDLGSAAIIGLAVVILLFLAGARWWYVLLTFIAALPVGGLLCIDNFRWQRLMSFLDPWQYPYGAGYQLLQSLTSLAKGGWLGMGLGNGTQKLFYLPDAHTDFIFAVIGEELGLLGCYFFLILFFLFMVIGVRIALRAPDQFGMLLAAGLTFLIGIQMIMNVGIVFGLLPTKGMALPFLSYGGSALLVTLMAVGILINISRQGVMRSRPR